MLSAPSYPVACGRGIVNRNAAQSAAWVGISVAQSKLVRLDDEMLAAYGTARPGGTDPESVTAALLETLTELLERCPEDHWLHHGSIRPDSMRGGKRRGNRYQVALFFEPRARPRQREGNEA